MLEADSFLILRHLQQILWNEHLCRMYALGVIASVATLTFVKYWWDACQLLLLAQKYRKCCLLVLVRKSLLHNSSSFNPNNFDTPYIFQDHVCGNWFMLTQRKKFCVFAIDLNPASIPNRILFLLNIFLTTITQVLPKFSMPIDRVTFIYR